MQSTETTTRHTALGWWEHLSEVERMKFTLVPLIGEEIESIWYIEVVKPWWSTVENVNSGYNPKSEQEIKELYIMEQQAVSNVPLVVEKQHKWDMTKKIGVRITKDGLPDFSYDSKFEMDGILVHMKMIQEVVPASPSFYNKAWKVFDTVEEAEIWINNPVSDTVNSSLQDAALEYCKKIPIEIDGGFFTMNDVDKTFQAGATYQKKKG